MAKDRSLVRASDIGAWTFCNRAWWLANVRNITHNNPAVLAHGDQVHSAHGGHLRASRQLRTAGLWLIAAAMILAGIALLAWLFLG